MASNKYISFILRTHLILLTLNLCWCVMQLASAYPSIHNYHLASLHAACQCCQCYLPVQFAPRTPYIHTHTINIISSVMQKITLLNQSSLQELLYVRLHTSMLLISTIINFVCEFKQLSIQCLCCSVVVFVHALQQWPLHRNQIMSVSTPWRMKDLFRDKTV